MKHDHMKFFIVDLYCHDFFTASYVLILKVVPACKTVSPSEVY